MALPLVGLALTAAKSGAISSVGSNLRDGVTTLLGGKTATDRDREQHAEQLLAAALNGNSAAVTQLLFEAFEPRTGAPGDSRTPVDRKMSPADVRNLAKSKLQAYYRTTGAQPPAQYASALNIPVPAKAVPLGVQLLRPSIEPIVQAVGDAAVDSASARAAEGARAWLPYALAAGGIVLIVVLTRRPAVRSAS